MKLQHTLLVVFILVVSFTGFAQITPPGLGKINTSAWGALAAKQSLNKEKTISSTTYLGMGSTSTPGNYDPFYRAFIYVVNEEISHQFAKHWKYSGAVSYRWQNEFESAAPYRRDDPDGRQELRFYARYSYLTSIKKVKLSVTARPELRLFYNPDFTTFSRAEQFRTRFSCKASIPLNEAKTKKISTAAEILLATNKSNDGSWDKYQYGESRFTLYYSVTFPEDDIMLNFGYMNNLVGRTKPIDAHYIAFDITLLNPFTKHKAS